MAAYTGEGKSTQRRFGLFKPSGANGYEGYLWEIKLSEECAAGAEIAWIWGGTFAYSENEYQKSAARRRHGCWLRAKQQRESGLECKIHGHMNKHLLKVKWMRIKQGVKVGREGK